MTLDLKKLWLVETAAEARSSLRWVMSTGKEGVKIYSPSLGPARKIVSIAAVAKKEFGEYIQAFDPGTVKQLLTIATSAMALQKKLSEAILLEHSCEHLRRELDELTKALEGVTRT